MDCPPKRLVDGVVVVVPKREETGVSVPNGFSDAEPNSPELPVNNFPLLSELEKRLEVGSSSMVFPPGPIAMEGLAANKLVEVVVASVGLVWAKVMGGFGETAYFYFGAI